MLATSGGLKQDLLLYDQGEMERETEEEKGKDACMNESRCVDGRRDDQGCVLASQLLSAFQYLS